MSESNRFKWKDAFSVGNEKLDEQHKALLQLCESINEKLDAEPGTTNFANWIMALNHYAKSHFKTEEELLKQVEYPELQSHEHEHVAFESKLGKLHVNNIMGHLNPQELREFVNDWWLRHILESDMKYKAYFDRLQKMAAGVAGFAFAQYSGLICDLGCVLQTCPTHYTNLIA